jgi:hypothetical protein
MKKVLLQIWRFIVRVFNYLNPFASTTKSLTVEDIADMVSDGKVFSANFVKKDGTIRTINCRTGVVKHLKGGTLRFDPISKNLLPVFDMSKNGYRFINFITLNWIKIGGKKYTNFKR